MTVESGGSGAPMSERMQSLLSRAVEDQLSEQRQIAGVLTDLRGQLQHIAGDVAALRQETHGGGSSDAALSTVSADVREAVRLLGERLDGVARLVQQRGTDLAELRALVEQMHTAVRSHGEALGGVSSGLTALPAFGERIGGLQDSLGALHERLAGLDAVTGGLGTLQQRVDVVDQGLRDLRSAFAAVGARMAELPGRADLDGASQRAAAALDGRLGGLEQAVAELSAQLTSIAAAADGQGHAADDEDQVAQLRAELSRFATAAREDTHGLGQRLTEVDGRLTEVLEALTPDEDAGTDAVGEPDDTEDPVLAELADLREALLGEDGLAARVDAAATGDLDDRIGTAVEQAVAASEERLSAHIDEAVLALAEALLRRRVSRPPAATTPPAPAPSASPPAAAPPDPQDAAEDEPEPGPGDDVVAGDEEEPAWQTPAGPADATSTHTAPSDAERRRRPWWRPGD